MSVIVIGKPHTITSLNQAILLNQRCRHFLKSNGILEKDVTIGSKRIKKGLNNDKLLFWYKFKKDSDANLFLLHFSDTYEIL